FSVIKPVLVAADQPEGGTAATDKPSPANPRTVRETATPIVARAVANVAANVEPARKLKVDRVKAVSNIKVADKAWAVKVLAQAEERKQKKNFKTASMTRKVSFHFDPNLSINLPIYAALLADETLGDAWMNTDFGWIRKASFPNTVYRLPDEVRLAYNAAMGAPYMIPALYRDAEGEPRVRVTLGATPWHDPEKLVRLRDYLHRSTAGLLAAPHVVVGGYEEARLRLTSAFPEEIRSLQGDGIE